MEITYTYNDPYAVRGMPFHTEPAERLVFVSEDLVAMGCPTDTYHNALKWAAMGQHVALKKVSVKATKLISRTQREMTFTLEIVR